MRNQIANLPLSKLYSEDISELESSIYGKVTVEQACDIISAKIKGSNRPASDFTVAIGTDSQSFSTTKVVSAVVLRCEGNGGIFFYKIMRFPKLSVHDKIVNETVLSINLATKVSEHLKRTGVLESINFQIHCDVGKYGKTNNYLSEVMGMVKSCDFDCVIKPNSYASSGVANMLSK